MAKRLDVAGDQWKHAVSFLPDDLDTLAVRSGAVDRWRDVKGGAQLLRMFLLYASVNSFQTAAALATSSGLIEISGPSLHYRLVQAELFLENVLLSLTDRMNAPVGFRLFVVDATTVSGPGSKGTDWRIHVGYDLVRGIPGSIYTTDRHVGESLKHHPLEPGYLAIADIAYGTASNVHFAREAGADFLIRVQRNGMRLFCQDAGKLDWIELEKQVPATGAVSFWLRMPVPPQTRRSGSGWATSQAIAWHDVRLVAARNRDGEVVWLLTNLNADRLSNEQACELYRVRWQVELYFKRLKSIGDLDVVTSRDGPTAKAALLAKLILLVLANLLCDQEQAFSPYGYRLVQARSQPVETVQMRTQEARGRTFANEATKKALQPAQII